MKHGILLQTNFANDTNVLTALRLSEISISHFGLSETEGKNAEEPGNYTQFLLSESMFR